MKPQKFMLIMILIVFSACGSEEEIETEPIQTPEKAPASLPTPEITSTENPVEVISSISYSEDHIRHTLDVYLPGTGDGPFTTIIGIHGGAFRSRSKSLYAQIGPYFAQKGFAFVSINYRMAPIDSYPAQVNDSFCALAWVHANSEEYGFDPEHIAVLGGSAGGYLASMVATVDDPSRYLNDCPNDLPNGESVHAAVIFYGFYDFTNAQEDFPASEISPLQAYWGAKYEDLTTERLQEMSPMKQIDGSEPPFLLLHGLADTSIPSVMSERFANALMESGVEVELVLIEGAGHAFELSSLTSDPLAFSLDKIDAFLDRIFNP
jgi:acetyl esterase/lipase